MKFSSELKDYCLKSGIQKGNNLLFYANTTRTFFYLKKNLKMLRLKMKFKHAY
jgi:hypothetical protein